MDLNPYTEADLVERLSQIRASKAIEDSLAAGEAPTKPGQVARVAWDDSIFLFLVRDISQATVEGWFADIVVSPGQKSDVHTDSVSLGTPLVIAATAIALPAIAFDATVGMLQDSGSITVGRQLEAFADGDGSAGQRANSASTLLSTFHTLRGGTGTMAELLAAHNVTFGQLKALLTVDSPTAFAIIRGDDALTFDQASVLASEAGIDASELASAGPKIPDELGNALWEHRYRTAAQSAGAGGPESLGWTRLARGALALAARNDSGAAVNWHDRLERYIETAGL